MYFSVNKIAGHNAYYNDKIAMLSTWHAADSLAILQTQQLFPILSHPSPTVPA